MKHRKVDKSTVEYSYSIYCYILTFRKSPYYLIFEHIDNIDNTKHIKFQVNYDSESKSHSLVVRIGASETIVTV